MAIKTGIQTLIEERLDSLRGQRVGLVTHPAAVLANLTHTLDALLQAGVSLTALFGPEHGFFGEANAGVELTSRVDPRTGLPVHSLYGERYVPSAEALAEVDTLIFDMQDVGARFYTFISTLYHVITAAARDGKRLLVCDRPNPLNGVHVEGPLVAPGFESFVGIAPIPIRYGLTVGELARFFKDHAQANVDLEIIPLSGWRREMWFDQTGLPWVIPSTNMPTLDSATVYPGTCFLEGTNLSEGRGTTLPFELFGAPWLDAYTLADCLNDQQIPGARFRPAYFTPTASKHAGEVCPGAQLHVADREAFRPVRTGLAILENCRAMDPDRFAFAAPRQAGSQAPLDRLSGSFRMRQALAEGASAAEIAAEWESEETAFREQRRAYYMYD